MDAWEARTGGRVVFVPKTTEATYLSFVFDGGCSAGMPGRNGTGPLKVSLSVQNLALFNVGGNVCNTPGSCLYAHEIGHSIGLYHEHQRADRNRYVTVNPASVNCADNDVYKQCLFTENGASDIGEYDLSAVVAYGTSGSTTTPPSATGSALLTKAGACYATATGVSAGDGSKVIELYAKQFGAWKRFRSIGTNNGPDQPLGANLGFGVFIESASTPAASRRGTTLDTYVLGSNGSFYARSKSDSSALWPVEWGYMGGAFLSSPAAATLSGKRYVCGRGTDNALWCNWENCVGWCNWSSLGRPSSAVSVASAPALAAYASNKLMVFVRGSDNALWMRDFNGTNWIGWVSLGGSIRGAPAATSRSSGIVNVVANTSNGTLFHIAYNGAVWSPWGSIGCCARSGGAPAIAGRSGSLDVVFTGTDGLLWWMRWTQNPNQWTLPLAIGGLMPGSPAAVSPSGSSRVDVLKIGTDRAPWHRWLN